MNVPLNPSSQFDQRYYQNTGQDFVRRISRQARRRVHSFFMKAMQPGREDRILDIGTSDVTGTDANMLEQLYPHKQNLTCASLSDGSSILTAYPGVRHVRIAAGEPLPFDRNAFDIVYSNAVLEHVGSKARQKVFLEEMCRVAPRRFLVVPNRFFPIEHHTCIPFLHYLPKSLFRSVLRGTRYDYWSHEANLNYVSPADLRAIWPGEHQPTIASSGIGFGPWKSNLLAYQT
jgi:ubiquinone/menaquinone biosynthesis C-methylase UbiE